MHNVCVQKMAVHFCLGVEITRWGDDSSLGGGFTSGVGGEWGWFRMVGLLLQSTKVLIISLAYAEPGLVI